MKTGLRRFLRLFSAMLCMLVIFTLALPAVAVAPVDGGASQVAQRMRSANMPLLRSAVAVHRSADPYSVVIGQLLDGTAVTVLDTEGQYYRIDCYDMVGYIHTSRVSCADGAYRVDCGFTGVDTDILTARPLGETILTRTGMYHTSTALEGVPYVWGGTSPRGFDCSGFTQYVYRQYGIEIPRTCEAQLAAGVIIPKESLQCGDLVLFHRTNHPTALVTHVGMYLGDGKLIHAGSHGITIVELDSRYFAEHYLCARRILVTAESQTPSLFHKNAIG